MRRLLICLPVLLLACREEASVRAYRAPADPRWRMIAGICQAADGVWFFKAVGPSARLASHREAVEGFLSGVKVSGSEVSWSVPKGWAESKGRGERLATLRFGGEEPLLELTVTRLGGTGGGALANVNRWRGQMGVDPVPEGDLSKVSKTLKIDGGEILAVEIDGPRRPAMGPAGGRRGMEAPSEPPAAREPVTLEKVRAMFSFDLPTGWIDLPAGENRIYEFQAGEGNQAPKVTLSLLGGTAGTDGANINRWRQQCDLEPLSDEEAVRTSRPIPFFGAEGRIVEVSGRERAITVAFVLGSDLSIFLKMDGRPDPVAGQRAAFEAFARSARMKGRHD